MNWKGYLCKCESKSVNCPKCFPAEPRPTRIVAFDEDDGEWTVEATDDAGVQVSDFALWINHENGYPPMTLAEALNEARVEFGGEVPHGLPVYVMRNGELSALANDFSSH